MIFLEEIQALMEKGGYILWIIFLTLFVFWFLILERYYFIKYIHPQKAKEKQKEWFDFPNKGAKTSLYLRHKIITEASMEIKKTIPSIKTLIALFPLLGLLGTITGMIAVFDVMSFTGTGNARLMAGGISKAILPTMAGMVSAICGLYFSNQLDKILNKEIQKFKISLKV